VNAAAKGSYYKLRTKRWLETKGYAVAFMERIQWIPKGHGHMIPVKRDQFGADLLAMNRDEMILVQVKFGKGSRAAARRTFDTFPIPPFVSTWIVSWEARARTPEIQVYAFSGRATRSLHDSRTVTA